MSVETLKITRVWETKLTQNRVERDEDISYHPAVEAWMELMSMSWR